MLRPLLWIGVPAAASFAFAVFVVRPTQPAPPDESVAEAWNESIGRLGVWPIYPPEEDIYVGDLWAVLLDNGPDDTKPGAGRAGKAPILSTAARIGHIDLTGLIKGNEMRRIRFREDEGQSGPAGEQGLPPDSVAGGIRLSLIAFPGVSITHGHKAATSFGAGWFGWSALNETSVTDEIHLTDTSTYGVPLGEAYGAMIRWCSAEGRAICTDAYARRVLAQTGITGTLDVTADGSAYANRIELRLITRAFLARTISQRRSSGGGGGLGARTSPDGVRAAPNEQQGLAAPVGDSPPTLAGRGQALAAAADAGRNGTTFLTVRADGSSIEIRNTTYASPIVFGYRAASKLLEPVTPDPGTKP